MRHSDDQIRAALRAEASAHHPDRDAMLDRITRAAMHDGSGRRRAVLPEGRRGPRVRLAAVVAAVVTVFGGGGVGTWALAGSGDREEAAPAPSIAPATTTAAPVVTDPVSIEPSTPAATTAPAGPPTSRPTPDRTGSAPSPSLTRGQPGFTRVSQGPLWSDGSIDPGSGDTQGASVVTLKTTEELTALEVVIRVARTDGLVSRGGTKQTPGGSVSTTVTEEAGALLYRFTLSSADTLGPGTYTFTAKYTHPSGGRNAGGDTYEAVATTATASPAVYGNFFPTR
ncbi:hypothetical protein [Actinoplanes sp. CA-252034]|uniref:hypothetical protein n=1 Tax=Actinoplanes sp. CA-252034 TaxID=3239906 RepID=UPI003D981A03